LLGQSISFVLDVNGRYPAGEQTVYTDMYDTTNQLDLGFQMSATYMKVSYYPETNMVKEYDLTLETRKNPDDLQSVTYSLKVNKPLYINGYKIYLMNYADDAVVLTAKYNPMEYTVLFGIFATLAGTVIMCLFRKDGGSDV
jgi:cytochrome c biogenesis protein ResB